MMGVVTGCRTDAESWRRVFIVVNAMKWVDGLATYPIGSPPPVLATGDVARWRGTFDAVSGAKWGA